MDGLLTDQWREIGIMSHRIKLVFWFSHFCQDAFGPLGCMFPTLRNRDNYFYFKVDKIKCKYQKLSGVDEKQMAMPVAAFVGEPVSFHQNNSIYWSTCEWVL